MRVLQDQNDAWISEIYIQDEDINIYVDILLTYTSVNRTKLLYVDIFLTHGYQTSMHRTKIAIQAYLDIFFDGYQTYMNRFKISVYVDIFMTHGYQISMNRTKIKICRYLFDTWLSDIYEQY